MDFFNATKNVPVEKDVCEYHVYLRTPSHSRAQEIHKLCLDIASPWPNDYIWQDQPFKLQVHADHTLSGTTRFGDCIEDEWLIVWILRELSKRCHDVFIRITDTDGEFLLIESARYLPRWLDPDTASNRCWIHKGELIIIEPTKGDIQERKCPDLTLEGALEHLRKDAPVLYDSKIQSDGFLRISKYPEQAKVESHHVRCLLPRAVATMLHRRPSLIAPTCRAFYARDPLQSSHFAESCRILTTNQLADQVDVTIRFTRTLYALIKGARFTVPNWYPITVPKSDDHEAAVTGCKLLCGAAIASISGEDPAIFEFFEKEQDLASDQEISKWSKRVDSDDFLEVDFTELERAMASDDMKEGRKKSGTQDSDGDETVKKMVEQMSRFMDRESNLEGAEFSDDEEDESDDEDDDDDDEDDEEYDEDSEEDGTMDEYMQFLRTPITDSSILDFLRHPTDLPSTHRSPSDSAEPEKEESEEEEEEEEEEEVGDLKEYMKQMDSELLSNHGISTLPTSTLPNSSNPKSTVRDEEDGDDIKIDYEMAKNLLESLKIEGGMSGPTAALLSRLGVSIPRNDDDDDDEEEPQGSDEESLD